MLNRKQKAKGKKDAEGETDGLMEEVLGRGGLTTALE